MPQDNHQWHLLHACNDYPIRIETTYQSRISNTMMVGENPSYPPRFVDNTEFYMDAASLIDMD